MPVPLSETARKVLDAPSFATIATVEPDGRPQLSVVWVTRDDAAVLVSILKGSRKYRNLVRDPRVTVLVYDPDDPYRYVQVQGRAELADDPDHRLPQELARKYTGDDYLGDVPGAVRVVVRVVPDNLVEGTGPVPSPYA